MMIPSYLTWVENYKIYALLQSSTGCCGLFYDGHGLEVHDILYPHLRVSINTTDGVGRDTEPSGV